MKFTKGTLAKEWEKLALIKSRRSNLEYSLMRKKDRTAWDPFNINSVNEVKQLIASLRDQENELWKKVRPDLYA